MTLSPDQFHMVTNIKAAPNSQGTLFQGGNASRYPRGYTPERQRQVRAALHPETAQNMRTNAATRSIVDNVTRSTVSPDVIRNVSFVPAGSMGRKRGMGAGLAIGGMYSGGVKFSDDFNDTILTGRVQVAGGEEGSTTPIHELGHHQSRLLGRPSSKYDTVARRGADEGFAETFAERNWRDRRGRPAADFSTNPLRWSGGMGSASRATFAKHFDKEREGTRQHKAQLAAPAAFAARGSQEGLFDVDLGLRGRKSTQGVARAGLAQRLGDRNG